MNIRERRQFDSLKRKIAFLILLIICLLLWIRNIYNDKSVVVTNNQDLKTLLSQKDSLIQQLIRASKDEEFEEEDVDMIDDEKPIKPKKKESTDTTNSNTKTSVKEKAKPKDTTLVIQKNEIDSVNE